MIDISNPADLKEVGFYETPPGFAVCDVAVEGDYAFIIRSAYHRQCQTPATIRALDIVCPSLPVEVDNAPIAITLGKITCSGNKIYVATKDVGLYTFLFDRLEEAAFLPLVSGR